MQQFLLNQNQQLIQKLNQRQILTTLVLMVMLDTHMDMLVMATQLTTLERDPLMLSQKLSQKLILSTMELMDTDMLDIHMPTTHTQLTIMERDLLMLRLNQKLIHTMLPTTDMLDIHMLAVTMVIHMELTMLESKSKTEKRSKD